MLRVEDLRNNGTVLFNWRSMFSRQRLLVQEDASTTASVAAKLLRFYGYDCYGFSDIEEARVLIKTRRLDLLLADANRLPAEFGEQVHRLQQRCKIVLFVDDGREEDSTSESSSATAWTRFLEKPLDAKKLLKVVEEEIGSPDFAFQPASAYSSRG